jgi:spore germination cell wall hydrolase CwlJ-like protein
VAQIAHQELWDSPVKDALFFHATYVNPGWARKKVATAKLARHVFYR